MPAHRLDLVHWPGEFWYRGSRLIGDFAPLQPGCSGVVLRKGGGDEGGNHAPPALACMGERIANEVDAAAVANWRSAPSITGLDAFVASETTSLMPRSPRPAACARTRSRM